MAAQINTLEKTKVNVKKTKGKKKVYKNNKKGKKNNKNKEPGRFAWLYDEPRSNQPKEKDIKGTMWYWCICHGQKGRGFKHTLLDQGVRSEFKPIPCQLKMMPPGHANCCASSSHHGQGCLQSLSGG